MVVLAGWTGVRDRFEQPWVATAAQFLTLRLSPLGSTHMGCDDSVGPGHAPRYLDVRSEMRSWLVFVLIVLVIIGGLAAYNYPLYYWYYSSMAVRNVIMNQIGDSTQVQFSVPPETMYFSSGADVVMETHDKIHIRICRANLYY